MSKIKDFVRCEITFCVAHPPGPRDLVNSPQATDRIIATDTQFETIITRLEADVTQMRSSHLFTGAMSA